MMEQRVISLISNSSQDGVRSQLTILQAFKGSETIREFFGRRCHGLFFAFQIAHILVNCVVSCFVYVVDQPFIS